MSLSIDFLTFLLDKAILSQYFWLPVIGLLHLSIFLILHNKKISKLIQNWNFGPNISSCKTVKYVANFFAKSLKLNIINEVPSKKNFKTETSILRLSNFKSKKYINWHPKWTLEKSLDKIVEWNNKARQKKCREICEDQIFDFLKS